MARQIIWTITAQSERREILAYWVKRNKSKTYSRKLNILIVDSLKNISKNPLIGRKTEVTNVRVKIIRDYLLFYEITASSIYVLSIWDSRRDASARSLK